jgi:hypothetical protein
MVMPRTGSYVPAVSADSSPEEIAATVSRWQARYQPAMPTLTAEDYHTPPPPPAPQPIEAETVMKEVAANWFAEARKQDAEDEFEIRNRVSGLYRTASIFGT